MSSPGTAWCAPGEGAAVATLGCCLIFDVEPGEQRTELYLVLDKAADTPEWDTKTNLTVTGHPFTSADCERILSERFQVGP